MNNSLKICILGDFTNFMDEGMKNIAHNLTAMILRDHRVLTLNLKEIHRNFFWTKLRSFKPDIVLYIPGPSILSFIIARSIRIYCELSSNLRPKIILLATNPRLPKILYRVCNIIKPDLVLVQSLYIEEKFSRAHLCQRFLPNGVDTKMFIPVNSSYKTKLRRKYGLGNEFLILHVGPIRKTRGLEILAKISEDKRNQVLIIGSTSIPMDTEVNGILTEAGCVIWRKYFEEIREIYQLVDLYVFPVTDERGCIQLPLSVMEAMACNLPVISTKFGALPKIFVEGNGLIFVDEVDEIIAKINQVKNRQFIVKTREKVMPYSWERVNQLLNRYFHETLLET